MTSFLKPLFLFSFSLIFVGSLQKLSPFARYKGSDSQYDGDEKIGPTHPDPKNIDEEFRKLITWYENEYLNVL